MRGRPQKLEDVTKGNVRRSDPLSGRELAAGRDPHPWRAAVLIGLLVVAAEVAYVIVVAPAFRHVHPWWIPDDAWVTYRAAEFVARGDPLQIYRTPLYVAGPISPFVIAPVAWLARALGLAGSPWRLARPGVWLLYGSLGTALGIPLLAAARAAAWEAGVRTRLALLQVAVAVLAVWPMTALFGHFEDVLALTLVLLAAREAARERPVAAALLMGVGVACKPWAVLGIPAVLAVAPEGRRLRTVVAAFAPPAILVVPFLAADWRHAAPGLGAARSFPAAGHAALWVSHPAGTIVGTPFRAGAVLAAAALAWWWRGRTDTRVVLAGLGLAFLARVAFEPVVFQYYLGPGLALLLLAEWRAAARPWRTPLLGILLLVWFLVWPTRWIWWGVAAVLVGGLVATGISAARSAGRQKAGEAEAVPSPGAAMPELLRPG